MCCRRPTGSWRVRTGARLRGGPVGGRQTTRDIALRLSCARPVNNPWSRSPVVIRPVFAYAPYPCRQPGLLAFFSFAISAPCETSVRGPRSSRIPRQYLNLFSFRSGLLSVNIIFNIIFIFKNEIAVVVLFYFVFKSVFYSCTALRIVQNSVG